MKTQSRQTWLNARFLGVPGVILCMLVGLLGATIKTKDGKIVEGMIRGPIVQKSEVRIDKSAEGTRYLVYYNLYNGEDIELIDEEGVHRSHVFAYTVSAYGGGGLPDDFEVFKPGLKGFGIEQVSAKGLKYYVGVMDYRPRVPSKDKLLGEFRTVKGKDVFIPALHVTTKEGVVDIPLADIVAFKSDAKKNP